MRLKINLIVTNLYFKEKKGKKKEKIFSIGGKIWVI